MAQLNISQELTLTSADRAGYARNSRQVPVQPPRLDGMVAGPDVVFANFVAFPMADGRSSETVATVQIILNGEPVELEARMSVSELLSKLSIDQRRVAVEHNLAILKRPTFGDVIVDDGDTIEIVNFVGGG